MYIEERVDKMEQAIEDLQKEIQKLQGKNTDEILTPKEFAAKAKLNENTVYCWIREGRIRILPNLGKAIRIPMSQFYDEDGSVSAIQTTAEELKAEFIKKIRNRYK